jgi:2,4-dienoyl-CoA reductase-like NADH-dependent reductase (Old Yellow Enzyme family)
MESSRLFDPVAIGGFTLRNRIAMAPMTSWAAHGDGTVSDDEDAYYRRRAGGVGLVVTGCSHVQANGVGFTGEFSADDDRFIPSLARLAAAAKSGGAPAILQIFHAGVKTRPELVSDVVAASAVPGEPGPFVPSLMPRALTEPEIHAIVDAFGQATRRAIAAGFDGVELHGAHGFLVQNFLSPHFNRRADAWGGSLAGRMRFALAVVAEMRRAIAAHADRPFLLGYRLSPDEPDADGLRIADSLVLIDRLIAGGIDYLHASLASALETTHVDATDGRAIIDILVDHVAGRVPIIAAGQIRSPDQAVRALDRGLSLVAIGQALVMNPDWVNLARQGRSDAITHRLDPAEIATLGIPPQLWAVIAATPGWFDVRSAA